MPLPRCLSKARNSKLINGSSFSSAARMEEIHSTWPFHHRDRKWRKTSHTDILSYFRVAAGLMSKRSINNKKLLVITIV